MQRTHERISPRWVGEPIALADGRATVRLRLDPEMAADERGLVHGGFTFGLADYAAMLAVNEPTVVLGSAQMKFLRPTVVGDELEAEAVVQSSEGKKRIVQVKVTRGGELVAEGELLALVPSQHVLQPR